MLQRIISAHNNVVETGGPSKYAEFLTSLRNYWEKNGRVTFGQESYLKSIEETYSDHAVAEHKSWVEEYNDDLRDIAVKCASYYSLQPEAYFHQIVSKVLADKANHVLSKKEFTKMCMNRYAQRVIEEYNRECKFSVGDLVTVRASNRVDLMPDTQLKSAYSKVHLGSKRGERFIGLIMEVNARPIHRACKGSRVYKVKFTQALEPIYVCERDIKKTRR